MRAPLAKDPNDRYQSAEEIGCRPSSALREARRSSPGDGGIGDADHARAGRPARSDGPPTMISPRALADPTSSAARLLRPRGAESTGGPCGRGSPRSSSWIAAAIGGWFLYREVSNKLRLDEARARGAVPEHAGGAGAQQDQGGRVSRLSSTITRAARRRSASSSSRTPVRRGERQPARGSRVHIWVVDRGSRGRESARHGRAAVDRRGWAALTRASD